MGKQDAQTEKIQRIIARTVEWDAMCETLHGLDKAAQIIIETLRPQINEDTEYPGLEIIGQLDTWRLRVRSTPGGALIPDIEMQFKVITSAHTLSLGEEAIRQLEKTQRSIFARGRSMRSHYARVRVDLYVDDMGE